MSTIINEYSGFTLIELIVTMVLAAIVLTLGIPSFQRIINDNRLATVVNEFVTALNLARSEAIKRGIRVTLCKSDNGTRCVSSGGYEQGWIIFVDTNSNAIVDSDEFIIRVFSSLPAGTGMTLSGNLPVAQYVSYTSTGVTQSINGAFQAGTLTLCQSGNARQIVISSVGRIRTKEVTC